MRRENSKLQEDQSKNNQASPPPLVEGVDYYLEGGRFVFTTEFHLKRGHCCESGCRHCPYGHKK